MQEAGFMNLLRTLLILVVIYYAFKFLVRLFAPYLMKKMVSKMQENQNRANQRHQQQTDVNEGETIIDRKPKSSTSKSKNDVGEYVDFEEIE